MEVSTEKNKFTTENSRDYNCLQTEYLSYHKKLKNEIEAIPKEYKKFFRNALNKRSFDMEVYIPQVSEKNRKMYPGKNYLINKLIQYDKLVNFNKDKKEKNSKDLSKFAKDYNFLIDNNSKQREYVNNLLNLYKSKGYELGNIEYTKNENIFNRSILLDHKLGEDTNKDVLKFGNDEQNRKNFITDNQLLFRFNDIIHENKSPNAASKNKNKIHHQQYFSHNINDFIKGIKSKDNNNSNVNQKEKEKKNIIIKLRNKKIKKKTKLHKSKNSKEKGEAIGNKDEEFKELNEGIEENNLEKSNSVIKNNSSTDINKNKEEIDNLNISKSSKIDNTITTYYGNDSLIFNESKNNEENKNISNLKYSAFKDKNQLEKKELNLNISNPNYDNKSNDKYKNKLYLSQYNKNNNNIPAKNKYQITSFNKIENKEQNNNKASPFIFSKEKIFDKERKNKFKSKKNLKFNLPEINPVLTNYKKYPLSHSVAVINHKNNHFKELNNDNIDNNIQSKIKNLKETFKKNSKLETIHKNKEKEINSLYSTINLNPNFFEEYPFDRVEKYFRKYKKMRISKVNGIKMSNVHPLLENLENMVKEKELYKLVKSLNETKKDMYLRSFGTLDSFEKNEMRDFEKIKEYDDQIPLLKYEFAENILCNNEKWQRMNKKNILNNI